MTYINYFFLIIFIFSFNYILIKQINRIRFINIIDEDFLKPQAFHKKPIPRLGGVLLLINYLVFFIYSQTFLLNFWLIIFSIAFTLIGFLDDAKFEKRAKRKLIYLILAIIFMKFFTEISINNYGINFLNYFTNKNIIFDYLIITLCFLTIINGSNFIDGFNGLLIIHSIIICLFLLLVENWSNIYLIFFLICLIIIFLFNFPFSKVFLGDSGSYLIGFILSFFTIEVANNNINVSPIFFAILLNYLFLEVIFSFIRKSIILRKNPFLPDNKHLHMLVFKKIQFVNSKFRNPAVSIIINLIYLTAMLAAYYLKENTYLIKWLFLFLIIFYISVYLLVNNSFKNEFKK